MYKEPNFQLSKGAMKPTHPSRDQRILDNLAYLSYRTGELQPYLKQVAASVSHLLQIDWSVVTYCQDDTEKLLASSIDLGEDANKMYSLHGVVTATVFNNGQSLVVEDTAKSPECGALPEGYQAYLGVPLRLPSGKVIGTICSFHRLPKLFQAKDIQVAELFAERAAIAIDNYLLYQRQQNFQKLLEAEVIKRTQELREAQSQLIAKERLAAIGEFTSMIVHEIRNPLTTIKMALDVLLRRVELPESAQKRIELATEESIRLESLLQEILLYAKPQILQTEVLELGAIIDSVLETSRELPCTQGRQIYWQPSERSLMVQADADKIKQVIANLISNACEAIAPGESVKCTIRVEASRKQIIFAVQNGGDPIPAEVLPQLTQPFFTTKPSGTGLGLPIVKRIIEAHHGQLDIESNPEAGTTVSISLPAVESLT